MVGRRLVVVTFSVVVVAFSVVVCGSVVGCGLVVGCKVFRRLSSSFIKSSKFLLSSIAFCCSLVILLGPLVVDISSILASVVCNTAVLGIVNFFTVVGS